MKLSDLLGTSAISLARLRREIFALGGRHQGDPLAGALKELEDHRLSPERRTLLQAVVAHLGSGRPVPADAPAQAWTLSLADAGYIAVIIASATWGLIMVRALLA